MAKHASEHEMHHYLQFALMIALSFVTMYAFMYAMVDKWVDVKLSLGQLYMAGLMTAPMVLLELVLMRGMYKNANLNRAIFAGGILLLIGTWIGIRTEAGVGDRQFLRSMIPHHSGAIQMCTRSSITDREIRDLCKSITEGQQREIDQMNAILARLDR